MTHGAYAQSMTFHIHGVQNAHHVKEKKKMNGKNAKLLKKLGSNDSKGKRSWNSLTETEKNQVHAVFALNPKFAGYGLPAILEAIRDINIK